MRIFLESEREKEHKINKGIKKTRNYNEIQNYFFLDEVFPS